MVFSCGNDLRRVNFPERLVEINKKHITIIILLFILRPCPPSKQHSAPHPSSLVASFI